jgi:hypothetical protein
MKKKVLMSIVLLAFVTVCAVFAQSPTLDKLTFTSRGSGSKAYYEVKAANTSISGAVVIPGTYNNVPVTKIPDNAFNNCSNITSVTILGGVETIGMSAFRCVNLASVIIPASVTSIGYRSFFYCTNITSVTFGGSGASVNNTSSNPSFPGDLGRAYQANGAGTYTRPANGNTWTKQATASAPAPAPNLSLNDEWVLDGVLFVVINGNSGAVSLIYDRDLSGFTKDAVNKGYFKVGTQYFRNLRSTGNLTWSGQYLAITHPASNNNVATGTNWVDVTLTMSPDGQTLTTNTGSVYTRDPGPRQY